MQFRLLTRDQVIALHDAVLNLGELEGLAGDKSLEGALGRIEFRIQYGLITDVYDRHTDPNFRTPILINSPPRTARFFVL